MTRKCPGFAAKDLSDDLGNDLGNSHQDLADMQRRGEAYGRELTGPDPEIAATDEELRKAKPFKETLPALCESIKRTRGRPRVESPKLAVTLRLDPSTLNKFMATGKDWRARMVKALEKAEV